MTSISKKIKRIIRNSVLPFVRFAFYSCNSPKTNKGFIHFNISNIGNYGRYFYLLVKFFQLEGYRVSLERKFSTFQNILEGESYLRYLIEERIISFSRKNKNTLMEFNDSNLSSAYFDFLLPDNKNISDSFFIPISMHPIFYHRNTWAEDIEEGKRIQSIFMAGNFNEQLYGKSNEVNFNVIPRPKLLAILQEKNLTTEIKALDTLEGAIKQDARQKCFIVNTENCRIPINQLRNYLNHFAFYLSCPGVVMPYCHNIVEAMSAGCIPLIQKEYANMMQPPLIDKVNAVFFNTAEDLPQSINMAYNMDENTLTTMQKNVMAYYQNHLTPTAVIENMLSGDFKKFYLLAEQTSVKRFVKAKEKLK